MRPKVASNGKRITVLRWLIFVVAMVGVAGVSPIALDQLNRTSACPVLGPVPACYVVFFGYAFVAVSAVVPLHRWKLFLAGWTPLFILAASGTALELFGTETCPRSDAGVPTCYFSLAMLVILVILFVLERFRAFEWFKHG